MRYFLKRNKFLRSIIDHMLENIAVFLPNLGLARTLYLRDWAPLSPNQNSETALLL